MRYQNVRLNEAQLFDPSRVTGWLRVARKSRKTWHFWLKLDHFSEHANIRADTKPYGVPK